MPRCSASLRRMRRKSSWPSTRPEAISERAASIMRRASSSSVLSFSASASSAAYTASRRAPGAFSANSLRPAMPRAARPARKSFLTSARLMRVRDVITTVHYTGRMQWEDAAVARWLAPLSSRTGELADVFGERRREVALTWRDGEVGEVRVQREEGVSARWRFGREERLAYVPGVGEASVREAVRALRMLSGREPVPIRGARSGKGERHTPAAAENDWADLHRWVRRLTAILGRSAPRHRFFWRVSEIERRIVASGLPPMQGVWRRRLVSLEGSLTAASRHGRSEE